MSDEEVTPTVVLGFDALSFRYLDAFDLPAFDALRARGRDAPLESTFPPWTGSAWPSLYTGVAPGHHGVFSFFDFRDGNPGDADVVTRRSVRAPALWDYLTAHEDDLASVVLNVPVTHPADDLAGTLVPGYLAPEDAAGSPSGIRDELSDVLGERYRIYDEDDVGDVDADRRVDNYCSLVDLRRRAGVHLLETTDWDLAFLQVQKTDTVFHNCETTAAHRRVYRAADSFLDAVLSTVGDDVNVVVCSDHGIGPTTGYKIYVNELLRRNGLLTASAESRVPTLDENKTAIATAGDDSTGESDEGSQPAGAGPVETGVERATAVAEGALAQLGVTPGDVYAAAARLGVADPLRSVLPETATDAVGRGVDWANSQAYCRNPGELGVRINLRGREAAGTVPESEYETVRTQVLSLLRELQTPDGRDAFEWVKRREAVYDGPYVRDACDVLFKPRSMNNVVATSLLGRVFVPVDKFDHEFGGVFLAAGPSFDESAEVGQLSLPDVAPIVLAALGCAVPRRMTGTVPAGLLDREVRRAEYGDVSFGEGERGGMDDDSVERRLEDLGYL